MPQPFQIMQNPFDNDQFFETEILAGQTQVLTSQKNSLLLFKKTYFNHQPSNNFFMTLKQQYINFAHLITKNALVATILMLFALTTVSASAAELFAPEEYKPSTILNLNSAQTQTSNPADQTLNYQVPADWKTVTFLNYSFSVPGDLDYEFFNVYEGFSFPDYKNPRIYFGKNAELKTGDIRSTIQIPRVLEVIVSSSDFKTVCFDKDGQEKTFSKEKEVVLSNRSFDFVSKGMDEREKFSNFEERFKPACVESEIYSTKILSDEYLIFDFNKIYMRDSDRELTELEKMTILNSLTVTANDTSSQSSSSASSQDSAQSNSSFANQAKLIYTNPNIPNFKFDYTGWQKSESQENGTYKTYIANFDKENSKIVFKITPDFSLQRGGSLPTGMNFKKLSNNLSRIKTSSNEWIYVSKTSDAYTPSGANYLSCGYDTEITKDHKYCTDDLIILNRTDTKGTVFSISFYGNDSLLSEVDEMVLNSGIQF